MFDPERTSGEKLDMRTRLTEVLYQLYNREAELSHQETKVLRCLERARWFPPGEGTVQLLHWQEHMEKHLQ